MLSGWSSCHNLTSAKMNKSFFIILLALLFLGGCRSTILDDPTLAIQYPVLQTSHVRLSVENNYDTEIAVLVDRIQTAGYYTATINGDAWLEGVYYYTLECKGINSTYYYKVTKHIVLAK
jgi:uncharacterized lipoprotein YajG